MGCRHARKHKNNERRCPIAYRRRPFWRTRYFAEQVINKPGRQIDPAETLATPALRVVQPDGRVRHWRWVATRGRWLRVVTEADGVTVHNAFWDRSFRP